MGQIHSLNLKQMIGQMVMAQAFGRFTDVGSDNYRNLSVLVTNQHIENFKIYHGHALGTMMLLSNLQNHANSKLLVGSDLERGVGQQISDFPIYPPAMALGNSGNAELAKDAGYRTAKNALGLGINVIFSPVLDISSPSEDFFGHRCISEDPKTVTRIGNAYLQGVKNAGAISVAKYFPGNGSQEFFDDKSAIVVKSKRELQQYDWLPFLEAISQKTDCIMVSPVLVVKISNSFVIFFT